jgi:hypothetical protein
VSGDAALPRKGWARLIPDSPGQVALLWALTALLSVANAVAFPGANPHWVSSTLYLSGLPILSGLLAAWVLRLERSTFHLLGALISLKFLGGLALVALKLGMPDSSNEYINAAIGWLYLFAVAVVVRFGYASVRSWRRCAVAVLVVVGVTIGAANLINADATFWRLSPKIRTMLGRQAPVSREDDQPPDIDADILWGAQPALIEMARAAFQPRVSGKANVYAMAVAGSGTQDLFSREAHEALRVAALRFGADGRGGALLSNGAPDQMHSPLATRANIAVVARAIGERADHKQDLLFLYLVSHGGQTAELESDLPNYQSVQSISSATTAEALKTAGVTRRVIVISACFAGSWIPALADDNTIVIAAAAKDRTSFGCDNSRRFTVFGEAFLGSLAGRNVSLHDVFEDAKQKITAEERKEKVTPSLPQAFVGRNMQSLWQGQQSNRGGK